MVERGCVGRVKLLIVLRDWKYGRGLGYATMRKKMFEGLEDGGRYRNPDLRIGR
jgi:hypothetical protein